MSQTILHVSCVRVFFFFKLIVSRKALPFVDNHFWHVQYNSTVQIIHPTYLTWRMHGESRRGPPSSLVQDDVDWSLFLFLFFKHIMLIVTTVVLLFFFLLDQSFFFFFFFQNEITNWFLFNYLLNKKGLIILDFS
jgi:hypothetical protein